MTDTMEEGTVPGFPRQREVPPTFPRLVSVVIPARNTAAVIAGQLEGLSRQDFAALEVVPQLLLGKEDLRSDAEMGDLPLLHELVELRAGDPQPFGSFAHRQ